MRSECAETVATVFISFVSLKPKECKSLLLQRGIATQILDSILRKSKLLHS